MCLTRWWWIGQWPGWPEFAVPEEASQAGEEIVGDIGVGIVLLGQQFQHFRIGRLGAQAGVVGEG